MLQAKFSTQILRKNRRRQLLKKRGPENRGLQVCSAGQKKNVGKLVDSDVRFVPGQRTCLAKMSGVHDLVLRSMRSSLPNLEVVF